MNGPPINGKGEIGSDSSVPLSQKFIFHGLRILLVVVLVGFVIALFPPKGPPVLGSYFEGLVL